MSHVWLCQGTALHLPLKDASVHCCVTSPPYYGLRDYGTGTWQGGDPACTHSRRTSLKEASITLESRPTNTNHEQEGWRGGVCGRCGATRVDEQLGLEASPEAYVAAMVQVFREVKRVLRSDGTLWLNLGDSYIGSANAGGELTRTCHGIPNAHDHNLPTKRAVGLQPKNLLGIPWRVALALQADGWILRSDVIWDKPSCMPESVQDRPTRSHEYVFLFSKQARYFYDAEAVRETAIYGEHHARYQGTYTRHKIEAMQKDGAPNGTQYQEGLRRAAVNPYGRNARTVWRIPSEPFSGSHFATFPSALVRRCLLAGAPSAVCSTCAAPYCREVERSFRPMTDRSPEKLARASGQKGIDASRNDDKQLRGYCDVLTTGFATTCTCASSVASSVVLDPFAGSGTTLLVARELGHHAVGIDLSYPYLSTIARQRLSLTALKAWTHGKDTQQECFTDLPLFGGTP